MAAPVQQSAHTPVTIGRSQRSIRQSIRAGSGVALAAGRSTLKVKARAGRDQEQHFAPSEDMNSEATSDKYDANPLDDQEYITEVIIPSTPATSREKGTSPEQIRSQSVCSSLDEG
jgi:hypothetical protein